MPFTIVEGADGSRFFFGDAVNKPLAEDQYSVWGIAAGGAQSAGSKTLPDVNEIFEHVSKTVGGAEFGIPRTTPQHKPKYLPINSLKATWPTYLPLIKTFCAGPTEWPILFAIAIQQAITAGKDIIDPSEALRLTMECAISMSKVDLEASQKSGTAAAQTNPTAQRTQPIAAQAVNPNRTVESKSATSVKSASDDELEDRATWRQKALVYVSSALVLAIAYYSYFVVSFVPSENWLLASQFIGGGASLALTVSLAIRMFRNRVIESFTTMRVIVSLVLTFALFWWLAFRICCYGVGDSLARSMGEPMQTKTVAYNYGYSSYLRCSPRLISPNLGNGKCISRTLHSSLPTNVPVLVQGRKLWIGYAVIDIFIEATSKK